MKAISKVLCVGSLLLLTTCGYSQKDGDLIGQAKKVSSRTNILCPNYKMVDVSLGILQNGVGSMSGQDMWLQLTNEADYALLRDAASHGKIVKLTYNTRRLAICTEENIVTSASLAETK